MINLESKLNASQLEAVTTTNGPVLVIAGAGSGKTRVIEYRVLHLVKNNIKPGSILLLTFTRVASRKMLERASRHDLRCRFVEGGTFHSFAYKILKIYGKTVGIPETFSVLDEGDSREAIQRCVAQMGKSLKEKKFPKKDTLKSIISASINKNLTIGKIVAKEYPDFLDYTPQIEELSAKYAEYKIQKGLLDYDDLLIYAKKLLDDQKIREHFSLKYQYIMIDEYQDTNKMQADISQSLASSHNNIMVVGDDAQSIYGFRGATHANIMDFPKRFPACRIIKLEENYRSTQAILNLANSVLENMENKYSKCLVSARKQTGEKPQIFLFNDAYIEAGWIAEKISELADQGVALAQQAVLFRSTYISIPLQAELSKRSIPFQVFGGLKFYETSHVKDLMAHLRVVANPKDEVSWLRLLMLIEGIGPKTAEKILKGIFEAVEFNDIVDKSLIPYIKKPKFSDRICRLQSAFKDTVNLESNIAGQFGAILDYYIPILKEKFDDWNLRLNDLETLKQIAARYDSLQELLADFAIESPEAQNSKNDSFLNDGKKPLTLSTIHSAKGLEWGYVFVLGMAEGTFPVSFSLNDDNEIEEEQRLFYVAVTRAKNNLLLSLHYEANRMGQNQFNQISRFIDSPNILSKLEKQAIMDPDI